jgi:O-antigen/teichoic acid export membrane protein
MNFKALNLFDQSVREVARGTVYVGAVQAVGIILGFWSQVILARTVGPEIFGSYSYIWSLAMIFGTLFGFGLPVLGTRLISEGLEGKNHSLVRGVSIFGVTFPLVMSSLVTLVFFLAMPLLGVEETVRFDTISQALLLVPALCAILLLTNFFKAWGLPVFSHVPIGLFIPVLLIIYSSGYEGSTPNLAGLIRFLAFGMIVVLAVALFVAWKGVIKTENVDLLRGEKIFSGKKWLILAFPLLTVALARVLQAHSDLLILGLYIVPGDLGAFSASKRIAFFVGAILVASNAIIVPKIARLHSSGKTLELQSLLTKITTITTFLAIIVALFIALFSEFLLALFDPSFSEKSAILTILVIGQVLNVAFGPTAFLLSMTGNEKVLAKAMLISMVITTTLTFLLISNFGMLGAAYGSVLCALIWNFIVWSIGIRAVGIDPSIMGLIKLTFTRRN